MATHGAKLAPDLDTPLWAFSRFVPSPNIHAVTVGLRTALFCERTQRLFDINDSAVFIWRQIGAGATCVEIAQALENQGLSQLVAMSYAVDAVGAWLRAGYLAPCEAVDTLATAPIHCRDLSIGSGSARLRLFGAVDPVEIDRIFGHFVDKHDEPTLTIDIVTRAGFDFIFANNASVAMTEHGNAPPFIKGLLTDAFCGAVERGGFVTHGALVSFRGKSLLLSGASGAGKTTLAIALAASGFAYGGDDVVHIGASGEVMGLPFAAAVKPGACDVLKPFAPELDRLAVFERPDGQLVRYVIPDVVDDGPRVLDIVVLLARGDQDHAVLESLTPLDALRSLIESGYSPQMRLAPTTLKALSLSLSRGACYRLSYGRLDAAIAALRGLV